MWKPVGCTSRDALEEAERRLGFGPLGHTGTLDPLACGVLVLLGGEGRKLQALLTAHVKEYEARIALGLCSASDDGEGPLWCVTPRPALPQRAEVGRCVATFEGDLEQVPPALSAVRVDGERAHRRVRRGEAVAVPPRRVRIERLEVVDWRPPILELRVTCGPGTFVRSLARDLGARLGTGGCLVGLRRTRVGAFVEADAVPVALLSPSHWLPVERLAQGLPAVQIEAGTAQRLAHGQRVPVEDAAALPNGVAIAWCLGRAVGVVEVEGGLIRPRRALHP